MGISKIITPCYRAQCECGWMRDYTVYPNAERALKRHKREECPLSDRQCSQCGTSLDDCSRKIVQKGHGCCAECFTYDTHDATQEMSVASLNRISEGDCEVDSFS